MVKDKQRSHDDLDMGLRVGQEEWPVQTAVYKGAHLGRRTSPDRTIFLTSLFGDRKNMKDTGVILVPFHANGGSFPATQERIIQLF